ncbi:MAG: hypothetical protein ACREL7_03135 [Longimicrobiales bacterium]
MRMLAGIAWLALGFIPAGAQIADRVDRSGTASGTVLRRGDRYAECTRFDRYGDHRWDEYGWDGDRREVWWNDGYHRERADRDRDRARCVDWIRLADNRRSRFAYEHDLLHERLWRDHMQWHRRHGNQPRNRGWLRAHGASHEKLAREHARWHRRYDREYGYLTGVDHRYDRVERDRVERDRLERDRLERDRRELDGLERQRLERERIERDRPPRARGIGRNGSG